MQLLCFETGSMRVHEARAGSDKVTSVAAETLACLPASFASIPRLPKGPSAHSTQLTALMLSSITAL